MKAKTIKAVLRSKINKWADTITDEGLKRRVKSDTIITGGCIASMLLKEKVNDYDIYFSNKETTYDVAKYYVDQFNLNNNTHAKLLSEEERIKIVVASAGVASDPELITDPGTAADVYEETEDKALEVDDTAYKPLFLSSNAITLSGKIQVIIRFWGSPDELHDNFDFVHCMNYWESGTGDLTLKADALECLLTRELRYVGSKYPLCSIVRLRKFIARHWTINAGQILKICMQMNELDLKNPKVLEEQLTGVDMAYFAEIIAKVNERDPERVDAAYLCEIIDRIF